MDPLSDILVYRPKWQSEGDAASCALLPVRITTSRDSATNLLATVSMIGLPPCSQVRGTHPLQSQ